MIRIHQVKCASPEGIEDALLKKLKIPASDLLSWKIHKKSVDARGQKVLFSYVIDADVKNPRKHLKNRDVFPVKDEPFSFEPKGIRILKSRPVVAGFGPAGLFAALLLAQYGYRPIVVERGAAIEQRQKDVDRFWKEGILNPESNVQFGMGGAGAFSDGKLTTRSKDPNGRKVLEELVSLGASPDILIEQHPHVGTDGFIAILKNARARIESQGGTFLFDTRLDGLETEDGHLEKIFLSSGKSLDCQALIAALGHSASDSMRMLFAQGIAMEKKPFAVGVRIEHLQKFIDKAFLKERAEDPLLTPARYQLTYGADNGKGVYTFCMCPGGYVIPSSCVKNTIVVNGMSYSDRGGTNANAALLVQVPVSDLKDDVFAGLDYQEQIESRAWELSQSYKAPAQLAKDYVSRTASTSLGKVKPTYELGVELTDLHPLFEDSINQALEEALRHFEEKIPGFLEDALLSAPETRSSSSLRLLRDASSLQSVSISGFYPCGEGAGYAGGIVTSAIDGLRCAMALMDTWEKPAADLSE